MAGQVGTGEFGGLAVLPLAADVEPQTFPGGANEWGARFSHDGRWIGYTSDESGDWEVYVRPFPDMGRPKWRISTAGGEESLWSPTRDAIYYRSGQRWMVVSVATDPDFEAAPPEILFEADFPNVGGVSWDIMPDGERFIMLESTGEPYIPKRMNVVLNWFEELKERVPTGRR